ncbi:MULTISPECIES: glycosyltransferase [unclassified Janthinobacterium]|uniref:glycosyltransferase n=1 Tax=unclassified Janthinobacterium TaxID=2610881 RepID=UPI0024757332|nr:glycosyltransferase [Janthinobacterium sp. CG_23.4]MDH6159389.1 GT2 family glycosyltransferase/SAM-dependent methyltransferase/glycosyltransferase involved in cell wall biosynthesis [Janthinobacterium sp. CG_23.4]
MQFTGERFIPTEEGKIQLEHYHRYAVVRDMVVGKRVLDVASGEGYGASMLADVALAVTGVDISRDAVQHAAATYVKSNLSYLEGSATALSFADASFDVVVSFETIEHLAGQSEMVSELRRVLRPEGILIISSPNRPVYSEESGEHNEFHVKELDFAEFDALLKVQFPAVRYLGQRMLMGSVIQPLSSGLDAFRTWHMDSGEIQDGSGLIHDPVYFLAICAASENLLPEAGVGMTSFVHPGKLDLVKQYVGFAKWAKAQDEAVAERDGHIRRLQHDAEEHLDFIKKLQASQAECDGHVRRLQHEAEEHLDFIKKLQASQAECEQQLQSYVDTNANLNSDMLSLHQVVVEREASLDVLRQMLADRDSGIDSLRQLLADRDSVLLQLRERLAERDEGLALMRSLHDKIYAEAQAVTAAHNARILEGLRSSDAALLQSRDQAILDLRHDLEYCHQHISSLIDETVRRGEWGLRLDAEIKEARDAFKHIVNTNSWRLTKPLREARRWVSAPVRQGKRYIKGAVQLAKRGYTRLPISISTRIQHRFLLQKHLPRLFRIAADQTIGVSVEHVSTVATIEVDDFDAIARSIQLPVFDAPLVSVIIPIYGKCDYTLRCLMSVAAQLPRASFEVIVVDDCSPDSSAEVLQQVRGIRLLLNGKNQGFIRSCNIGAKAATGKYLYFLNNDTEVIQGWLDELLNTFHLFSNVGFVGSKLIYPDGSLQEAGGIIWKDGSAWNFGRNQNVSLPVYNYAREVDYCSGASIMVPRPLFEKLGGFDEHYLPAYCEDSDLALKIRDAGYSVLYQPMSVVIHYEGITSGTDTGGQGAKAYQIENSKKLFQRWKHRLAYHQENGIDVDDAKDRMAQRRVLVLEHCTPTPDQDAGSVSVFNILLLLRNMGYQVTFIPEDNFLYMPDYTTLLQRVGIEVLYHPYQSSVEQHLIESGSRYDLAFLFRPAVVQKHLQAVRKYAPQAKVLFYTHDLHYLRMLREAALQNNSDKKIAALEMKKIELAAMRAVDASILVSPTEMEMLRTDLPDQKLHVLPLILDIPGTDIPFSQRNDIVFVGGFQHPPNIDAVQHFVAEVMPRLRPLLPGIRFFIVGSKPTAEIHALAADDVIISGFIPDLTSYLNRMRVAVAPLRYGAGVKGKIGTAMAAGLPTVATELGAEGMGLTDGENIFVADDPQLYAEVIARLYRDESLWNKISRSGIIFSEQSWGLAAGEANLERILNDIDLPRFPIAPK